MTKLSLLSRSPGSRKTVLILAILAAVAGAYMVVKSFAAGGDQTANLWVDANGGSCTRQATPVAYIDAQACSSLNAAYQAASPGDNVLVSSGTYTEQYIASKSGASSPDITMQPATGANVVIKELDIQGTSYLTLKNFRVEPAPGKAEWDQIIDFGQDNQPSPASHVTLDGITLDGRINGSNQARTGLGINGGTSYLTIKNSDLGFIKDQKVVQVQNYLSKGYNDHITFDNVKIHDDPQSSSDIHLECFWASSLSNSTLSRLDLYNCALPMIISHFGTDLPLSNVTIENSIFEEGQWAGGLHGYYSIDGCLSDQGQIGNLNLKYNYFAIPWGCGIAGGYTGLTAVGNIGPENNCHLEAVYKYNVWDGAKCDPTDKQVSGATSQVVQVGTVFGGGPGNYCPSTLSSPQVDAGNPTSYPPTDFLGNARFTGAGPDAGPCEYNASPPNGSNPKTSDINSDGSINIFDLSIMLSHFGQNYTQADLNTDNTVNIFDLSILLSHFGQ